MFQHNSLEMKICAGQALRTGKGGGGGAARDPTASFNARGSEKSRGRDGG
jgi:hypothetical protein